MSYPNGHYQLVRVEEDKGLGVLFSNYYLSSNSAGKYRK